jgi:DNA-binding NarL/FixJ family response regulator
MAFAIVAVPDLLFQSRFEAALRSRDIDVRVPASGAQCTAMLADEPALVVVDLQAEEFAAPTLIRQAAAGGAAVLAFGRHTEPGVLKAARDAGADRAVPRSQVADELPKLLDELLTHPAPGPASDSD